MKKIVAIKVKGDDVVHFAQTNQKGEKAVLCFESACDSISSEELPMGDVLKDARSKVTKYRLCPLCSMMAVLKLSDTFSKLEGVVDQMSNISSKLTLLS